MGLGKEGDSGSPPQLNRSTRAGQGLQEWTGRRAVSLLGSFFGKGASGILTGIRFMKTAYERMRKI